MQTPNLFEFATSELSQDAFICWLASWANPAFKAEHGLLHATATAFLARLLEIGKGPVVPDIRSIEIHRQSSNIDVLVVLNGDSAIIIEDKTDTKEHSGQLAKYKLAVAAEYKIEKIAAVYLKTGDQGNFLGVEEAGYGPFLRRHFIEILEEGEKDGVRSDIFADFLGRLRRIEAAVQSYQLVPIDGWDTNRLKGFYLALQQRLCDGTWDKGAHPGVPSLPFLWHWRDGKFLRLMGKELSFRIEVPEATQRAEKWAEWRQALLKQAAILGVRLVEKVRHDGNRMGVAAFGDDYRKRNGQGLLDFGGTVQILSQAELLMDSALETISGQRAASTNSIGRDNHENRQL